MKMEKVPTVPSLALKAIETVSALKEKLHIYSKKRKNEAFSL